MTGTNSLYEERRVLCERFHNEHPDVWALFVQFTLELIAAGREHFGASAVWERIRWETAVNPAYRDRRDFKVNNNFQPFYARWFMAAYPQHDGFFRTRRMTTQDREQR